jgi:hypothetical protein
LIKGFIEFLKIIRTRVACIVIDEAVFVLSFPGQGQAGTDGQHTDIDPIIKKKSGVKFLDCYSIPGPSLTCSFGPGTRKQRLFSARRDSTTR